MPPEDIQDITESMFKCSTCGNTKSMVGHTKDPFERMVWGVVGYVPHMRKDFKNPIMISPLSASLGGSRQALSLT